MPVAKKKPTAAPKQKTTAVKKRAATKKEDTPKKQAGIVARTQARARAFLARRPHRSFRRTMRRDYVRSLRMPGYWAFTHEVLRTLWQHKMLFLLLALTYGVLNAALVGLASQDTYAQLSETLEQTGPELLSGGLGALEKAGLLLASSATGLMNQTPTDTQRIFAALLGLMVWLTTVWLLRALLAGKKPKLRDGLYNSSAPLLSSFLVGLVVVVQLLPIALAAIAFSAATASGFLSGGIEAMVFWVFAGLLALLSVYWVTSSTVALVVVTLPGVYPMQALRTAGDLVIGRRVRILLRFLWAMAWTAVVWVVVMIPVILFDGWLKGVAPAVEWVPLVPVVLATMSALTVVWLAAYVYMLYRKVVDDGAASA